VVARNSQEPDAICLKIPATVHLVAPLSWPPPESTDDRVLACITQRNANGRADHTCTAHLPGTATVMMAVKEGEVWFDWRLPVTVVAGNPWRQHAQS
jgi:hypothetical protein